MKTPPANAMEARKTPVQARSQVTVEAIREATIQVLRQVGVEALTTTRVAARAGVSVGTLYQYFPNKQALLYASLEEHLELVVREVETTCRRLEGSAVRAMAQELVERFMTAKSHKMEVASVMYEVADQPGAAGLLRRVRRRSIQAIAGMLATASDAEYDDVNEVATMLYAAMAGSTRTVFEGGTTMAKVRALGVQLGKMSSAYLVEARRGATAMGEDVERKSTRAKPSVSEGV